MWGFEDGDGWRNGCKEEETGIKEWEGQRDGGKE